jgi:hypothetical protein
MVPAYMTSQPDITETMRTILVDWLIEVQENFELFHETLYLAVQITDRYLSLQDVKREYLQLVGATSMLIAAKFEVLRRVGSQFGVGGHSLKWVGHSLEWVGSQVIQCGMGEVTGVPV